MRLPALAYVQWTWVSEGPGQAVQSRGLWGTGAALCCGNPGCSAAGFTGRRLTKWTPVLGGLGAAARRVPGLLWERQDPKLRPEQEGAKVDATMGRGGHSVRKLCSMGTGLWWRAQGR